MRETVQDKLSEGILQKDKTKLFPLEQRKNFLEKLQKQILLKRFHKSLKGFDKPTDKRTFEQNKKIDFKIWIFTTFIQCNTIVQLTNYSVPRNNDTNRKVDNLLKVLLRAMHAHFITCRTIGCKEEIFYRENNSTNISYLILIISLENFFENIKN